MIAACFLLGNWQKSLIEDGLLQGLGGQASSDKAVAEGPLLVSRSILFAFSEGIGQRASSDKAAAEGPLLVSR